MKASSMPTAMTVPGKPERQDGEIVEEPASPQLGAHVEIGDGSAERYGDQSGSGGEPEAVEDAARGDLVGEERGLEVRQREVGEGRCDRSSSC